METWRFHWQICQSYGLNHQQAGEICKPFIDEKKNLTKKATKVITFQRLTGSPPAEKQHQ